MESLDPDVVINVAKGLRPVRPNTHQFPLEDTVDFDITPHLDPIADLIHQHMAAGKKVFAHCRAGLSRLPTVIVAYLVKHVGMPLTKALRLVSDRRQDGRALPTNPSFLTQLHAWDRQRAVP